MKNFKISFLALTCIFIISCATTHPGHIGHSINSTPVLPLVLSAKSIENNFKDSYQILEITLENTSDEWVKLNNNEVIISDPGTSKLSVVLGSDLKDWAQSRMLKEQKDKQNAEVIQAALITAGAIAIIAASSKGGGSSASSGPMFNSMNDVQTAGAITYLGGIGWVLSDAFSKSYLEASGVNKVPENHLYQSFSIPGKMFSRKWVLLNKPVNTRIDKLILQMETIEGKKDTYELVL